MEKDNNNEMSKTEMTAISIVGIMFMLALVYAAINIFRLK